ncbi:DUF554 domain-containing protein [Lacticigenium naphthae]|uniref:DUF554 domain-containing protein n=1 Tax=Lacticigenium naphthae TaxID=515351 RepID=UPI000420F240|nr:DUF554 domain-containing protein [Lacticigenium naphthae]
MLTGVIVNTIAIFVGGTIGLFINKGLPKKLEKALMQALALSAMYIGMTGLFSGQNTLSIILSLVLGTIIGEIIDLDAKILHLGQKLEEKFPSKDKDVSFSKGFVMASLILAVGALSIVGSLQSGLTGDHSILYTKAVMDGVTSLVLASSLGKGVLFSGFLVFAYQGSITLFAGVLDSILTDPMIQDINAIGSILIFALGLNILGVTNLKIMNFVPAVFVPVLFWFMYI